MKLLLIISIGIRLSFYSHRGYPGDVDALIQFAEQVRMHGPHGLYEPLCCAGAVVYPPVFPYLMAFTFGLIDSLNLIINFLLREFGVEVESSLGVDGYGLVVVKSFAMVGDLSLALLAWGVGQAAGIRGGWLSTAAVLLNPAFIYDGAVWGQVDSIFSVFLVGSIVGVAHSSWGLAGLLCSIAVLMKPQAIVLSPFVMIAATLIGGRLAVWKGLSVASVTILIILLPFIITGRIHGVFNSYANHIGAYPELTVNAYNAWWFICHIARETCKSASPGSGTLNVATGFSVIVFVLIYMVVCVKVKNNIYYNNKVTTISMQPVRRLEILLIGSAVIYASLFMIGVQMHERYLYPALAFLAPISLSRSCTFYTYLIFSLCSFLNMAFILPVFNITWVNAELGLSPFVISTTMIGGTCLAWSLLSSSEGDDQEAKRRMERIVLVMLLVVVISGMVALDTISLNVFTPWAIVGPALSVGVCVAAALEIMRTMPVFKQRSSIRLSHGP